MRTAIVMALAAVLGGTTVLAADAAPADAAPPAAPRTRAEVEQRLVELVNRQLDLSASIQARQKKLDEIWQDERMSVPGMDKLRQRRAALLAQVAEVEAEMRKLAAQQPEHQAEQRLLDEERAAFAALAREVEELRKRRFALP
jgi:Spy/CpxP family protein refolding chaperone